MERPAVENFVQIVADIHEMTTRTCFYVSRIAEYLGIADEIEAQYHQIVEEVSLRIRLEDE